MKAGECVPRTPDDEISALIETLHQTERRLEELTAGEVDSVTDCEGRTFLLRRAQEQLRAGVLARQAAILNALPAHIAMIDAEGSIISVNDSWHRFAAETLLQGPGSAIGLNYLDMCGSARGEEPSDTRAVAEGIRKVLRGEIKTFSIEYPRLSPMEERWFLLTVTTLPDVPPSGAVVMYLDVTAERQSEARARLSVEASLDAVVVADATGRITAWNAQAEKTFGWTPQQAIGQLLTDTVIPPRYQQAHVQGMRLFFETGAGPMLGKRIEMSALHQDGRELPVEFAISPIRLRGSWTFNAFIRDLTVQKRSEASLQRLAAAMDAAPDAIYLVDRDSMRFVYINEAACRMRQQTREEIMEGGPLDYTLQELERLYDDIIASGKAAAPLETLRKRKDGSEEWIELRRQAQRSADGWLIITIVRDITESKKLSAELQESDRRLSDMMDNIELVSIVIDAERRVVYCNDYFLALTGWRREELLGQMYVDFIVPSDLRDEVREVHAAMAVDSAAARHHENEIVTRYGERRLIRWNNSALRSPSGEVIGTASIGEDITERKRAEQALVESVRQQRQLNEQLETERARLVDAQSVAKVGSWETNLATLDVIWSDETHRIFGTDPDTFLPTHGRFLEFVHPEDRAGMEDAFNLSIGEGDKYHYLEHRVRLADGGIKFIEERWRVFRDASGVPARVVGTSRDISARVHADYQIHRLNTDLERRVEERTAELQAVNQELEAFDYSVSHDLRAPIRHVEGFSTMLLEDYRDKLDARGIDCLNRIQGAGQRMDQLVSDLLSLSLVSRGELNRKAFDLSALAQLVFTDLQNAESEREIEWVVAPGLNAHADRGLLRIVLENLIGNARKFTAGRDGAKIEFGSTMANGGLSYFVRDNGAGFDAAYADRLFAPFQRLHAQTAFKGTGIGLATVRRIITRHGGEVRADGVVDQGAVIYFTLP